nr:MAG TPA: hypothetical protein [Caudoviricetes sp.]
MRKSNFLTNMNVEKKMTAGVRHAKIFATIIAVLLIMLTIYSELNHMDNAAFQGAMLTCVALLARWLFDGMESIISLLCDLNPMPSVGTKSPDAAFLRQSSNVPDLRSIKMPEQAKYDSHETAGE